MMTHEEATARTLLAEVIARLDRDGHTFADEEHVSISDARIRCHALKNHSRKLHRLLSDARDLADAGHHERAVALLRGDTMQDPHADAGAKGNRP